MHQHEFKIRNANGGYIVISGDTGLWHLFTNIEDALTYLLQSFVESSKVSVGIKTEVTEEQNA
jgi:hypothetical protein